jgi:Helix-turn-helix
VGAQWGWDIDQEDTDAMALGDRIRFLRKEAGWSQAELAEKIGVDPGVNGHLNLPAGGHENSPRTATGSPRGRPPEVPGDGHGNSPRTVMVSPRVLRRGASPPCRRGRRRGGCCRRR